MYIRAAFARKSQKKGRQSNKNTLYELFRYTEKMVEKIQKHQTKTTKNEKKLHLGVKKNYVETHRKHS